MGEFHTTAGVSYKLEEIIKSANQRLILISPFLKLNERVKALLQEKDHLKIDVRFIYGKKELPSSESDWLASMSSIRAGFRQNLHAKCYLNENEALLTSMNLHEFSQATNDEMGVYVSRAEDPGIYEDILEEANRLWTMSSKSPVRGTGTKSVTRNSTPEHNQRGFCINCNKDIPLSYKDLGGKSKRPFCDECHKAWEMRPEKSFETVEKYCHSHGEHCPTHGEDHDASYARPICRDCYPVIGTS